MTTPDRESRKNNSESFAGKETTPSSLNSGSSGKRRDRAARARKKKVDEPTAETSKEEIPKTEEPTVSVKKKNNGDTGREQPKQKSFKNKQDFDVKAKKLVMTADSIKKVNFVVQYITVPGQDLFLVGDSSQFGNWDTENLVVPLNWTDDHHWCTTLSIEDLPQKSLYKFVCREIDKSFTWEEREDRQFDIDKIGYSLSNSVRLQSLGHTIIEKGSVRLECNPQTGVVTLVHTWND